MVEKQFRKIRIDRLLLHNSAMMMKETKRTRKNRWMMNSTKRKMMMMNIFHRDNKNSHNSNSEDGQDNCNNVQPLWVDDVMGHNNNHHHRGTLGIIIITIDQGIRNDVPMVDGIRVDVSFRIANHHHQDMVPQRHSHKDGRDWSVPYPIHRLSKKQRCRV